MTTKLKIGDVVRLNSGSPAMTVAREAEEADSSVLCVYWITQTDDASPGFTEIEIEDEAMLILSNPDDFSARGASK